MFRYLFVIVSFVGFPVVAQTPLKITLDTKDSFFIANEDSILIRQIGRRQKIDTVRASLHVNDSDMYPILFTNAYLTNDTLVTSITYSNEAFGFACTISICQGAYHMDVKLSNPIQEPMFTSLEPEKTRLKLSSLNFRKGTTIRGYVEYFGKCEHKNCWGKTNQVLIKGNFKILIE